MLVLRRADQKYFAAKTQKRTNPGDFDRAVAELKMLLKVDHPNIVKFEESFCNEKTNELVIIIEYCSCKFILFDPLICVCRRRHARSNCLLHKTGQTCARELHSLVPVPNNARTHTTARAAHLPLGPEA